MPPKKRARSTVDPHAERAAGRAATATDYTVAEPDYELAVAESIHFDRLANSMYVCMYVSA